MNRDALNFGVQVFISLVSAWGLLGPQLGVGLTLKGTANLLSRVSYHLLCPPGT